MRSYSPMVNKNELLSAYELVDNIIEKGYISQLHNSDVIYKEQSNTDFSEHVRLYNLTKIVYSKNENVLDKLISIYNTIYTMGGKIVLILHSDGEKIEFFIGFYKKEEVSHVKSAFESAFNGNFPGCQIDLFSTGKETKSLFQKIFPSAKQFVSVADGIPDLKNEDHQRFTQGIEKFIVAMDGKKYTSIMIAESIFENDIAKRKASYEEIYSTLVPFASQRFTYGENESTSVTEGFSSSFSQAVNQSVSYTTSHTDGTNKSDANSSTHTKAIGISSHGLGGTYAHSAGKTHTEGTQKSDTESETRVGGRTDNWMKGSNKGNTKGEGSSQNHQITLENKSVKNLLEKIDTQIKRISISEDYGMYDFAAYFISEDFPTTKAAASTYRAIMQKDNSAIERSGVVSWDMNNSKTVIDYLKELQHPNINVRNSGIHVTPATLISTKELSLAMNLPQKSVKGLPVKVSVEFAREIQSFESSKADDKIIELGNLYHLGKDDKTKIELNQNSLAMHTLITGSTGSGKSTTTYNLINELKNNNVKFLVIEPTKGEYKNVFGNNSNVNVYGTNCKKTPLLRVNPFSFPVDEIHVLEHIDRLVEIFNACWPMYAAMPAILKDAILNSYKKSGWDLEASESDQNIFPTFYDVLDNLEVLIEGSMYSDNTKADYKGALVTRVKSLTQGLIKNIFTSDALDDETLFENNVIVDLSRVGSSETKSLIMGILMLKLNEYRISSDAKMNGELKHVTILEEAHHILPRVSTQTSQESGNIKGKAVEMLSNAIAEMRTYGQGFIIVDQSPNMLDISAIRNTNTKIIMRLSELEDRNDIGKSAALTDEQINEIPKLPVGVAIVYQNG